MTSYTGILFVILCIGNMVAEIQTTQITVQPPMSRNPVYERNLRKVRIKLLLKFVWCGSLTDSHILKALSRLPLAS